MFKNVASQKLTVFAFADAGHASLDAGEPVTGDAANITLKIEQDDDGTQSASDDTNPTEVEDGQYRFDLTQAEVNGDKLTFYPESSTAGVQVVALPSNVIYTRPQYFSALGIESDGDLTKVNTLHGHTAQTADHTAAIADIPTVSEFNARTLAAADYFDPATDTVASVTTVGTCTTNTDMRGTDSALTTLGSNAPADWLNAAAVASDAVTKIQNGLSTYDGSDTSGVTTLLSRLSAARAGYLDNLNNHTAQSGDSYARLGAPAGASVSADIAAAKANLTTITGTDGATLATAQGNYAPAKAGDEMDLVDAPNATAVTALQNGLATASALSTVDSNVDSILVDTAEIGAAGAGLSAIPWNSSWDAEVQSEVSDALTAFSVVATTDLPANFGDLSISATTGLVDLAADQSGVTVGTVNALGTQAKADVNAEADTALSDIHLDHLLAADYDPASKPGTSTALLNELVENDGGVSRFTTNALEQSPTGGSAPSAADIRTEIDNNSTQLAAIVADTNELQGNQGDWATATGFSTHSAADVWSVATRVLTAGTNLNDPTAAAIADAVWDEAVSGHTTNGTYGKAFSGATAVYLVGMAGTINTLDALDTAQDSQHGTTQGKVDTAQSDLDVLTGTDGVTLATSQPNYAPAKVGDQVDLVDSPNATAVSAIQNGLSTLSTSDVNAQVVDVLRTDTLPDSYSADESQPTIAQAILEIRQFLMERGVSGTTLTVNKPDGTTAAMTFTLNDGTSPTAITRAT